MNAISNNWAKTTSSNLINLLTAPLELSRLETRKVLDILWDSAAIIKSVLAFGSRWILSKLHFLKEISPISVGCSSGPDSPQTLAYYYTYVTIGQPILSALLQCHCRRLSLVKLQLLRHHAVWQCKPTLSICFRYYHSVPIYKLTHR